MRVHPLAVVVVLASMLAVAGCAVGYDVKTDYDPQADFAAYRSFAVPPRDKADTPNQFDNSLVIKRIEGMVVRHLEARGLVRAEPGAADLMLRFWLTAEEKTDVSTVPSSPFYGPWGAPYPYPYNYGRWGPMYDDVIVRNYVEGTLVLDLVDRAKDELVWRAYVVGTLSRERETMYELVDEALGRAFRALPRESKAGAAPVWFTDAQAASTSAPSIAPQAD